MYLAHLWELAAGLPAIFPDGLPLRRKLYPWMLNLVIEEWQRKGWAGWSLFKSLRAWSAIALGWGLVPLMIGGVAYRLLVRHDEQASYLFLGLLAVSVLLSSALYQYARATVRNTGVRWRWLLPVFLTALALGAGRYGTDQGLKGNLPWTTRKILLRNADLTGLVIRGTDLGFADLSFAKLVKADLRGTSLVEADLHGVDLTSADLGKADLAGTDLQETTLANTKFSGANLYKAIVLRANLQEADLRRANLQGANLRSDEPNDPLGVLTTGLTAPQVKIARNWKWAFYGDDFLEKYGKELGLPQSSKEHTANVRKKLAELEKKKKEAATKK